MSISTLFNPVSMTSVLRTSFTSCRSLEIPNVIVLTFHVPNFKTGIFFLLPGACLTTCLSVFTRNPTHPLKLTGRGEAEPYGQEAPSLGP